MSDGFARVRQKIKVKLSGKLRIDRGSIEEKLQKQCSTIPIRAGKTGERLERDRQNTPERLTSNDPGGRGEIRTKFTPKD